MKKSFQKCFKTYHLILDCLNACQSVLIGNIRFLTFSYIKDNPEPYIISLVLKTSKWKTQILVPISKQDI